MTKKKERNKNNQEIFLDYSLHKRGFKAILEPTCCLSMSQKIDKKIVVWSWLWRLGRRSVDFYYKRYFLNPFALNFFLNWYMLCDVLYTMRFDAVLPDYHKISRWLMARLSVKDRKHTMVFPRTPFWMWRVVLRLW